jgi:hypothetical protein
VPQHLVHEGVTALDKVAAFPLYGLLLEAPEFVKLQDDYREYLQVIIERFGIQHTNC